MFASKTVFIIGAGASREVDLPVGKALATAISQGMTIESDSVGGFRGGDTALFRRVMTSDRSIHPTNWLKAAHRLRDGLPVSKSIDEFLDLHRDDTAMVSLGKAAIIKTILERERVSALWFNRSKADASIEFAKAADTWYAGLIDMLGHGQAGRAFENATFVSFNYDRCLEHFLFYAMRARYGYDNQKTKEVMQKARIFHPYGSVGPIPEIVVNGIEYGCSDGENVDYYHLRERIRTYTEERAESEGLVLVRQEVQSAGVLVFLGFGFHTQNMTLLAEPGSLRRKKVFATAHGISDADVKIVLGRIKGLFEKGERGALDREGALNISNKLTCANLLKEYELTLPLA